MKNAFLIIASLVLMAATALAADFNPATGDKDFDVILKKLNIEAKADLGKYAASLAVEFGTPQSNVDMLIKKEGMEPAEAYLALKLAKVTNKPVGEVVEAYKANKGQGWGAVARKMGVKPGSPEFHALKGKPTKAKDNKKGAKNEGERGKK